MKIINRLFGRKPLLAKKAFVRVSDTADGLLIHSEDADFRRDTHEKQREARLFSDRFYYVTPAGLLRTEEIPDWAGLIEIIDGRKRITVPAPMRDKDAPSWELIVSLLRNSGQIRRDGDLIRKENARLKRMVKDAAERLRAAGRQPWEFGIGA